MRAIAVRRCGDHHVLRLKQTPHDIQNCRFSYGRFLLNKVISLKSIVQSFVKSIYLMVVREWGIAGHQEMKPRSGDERSDQTYEVVVHITRVSQCGCRRWHDGWHKRVDLCKRWRFDMKSIGGDAIECRVVQNDDAISVQSQSLQGQ